MSVFTSLRPLQAAALVIAMAGTASATSLTVNGTAGYLSEWQLSGSVIETEGEFNGPLTARHVGLCSHDGPEEKTTELKLRMSRRGPWSQLHATLVLDGASCSFSGSFSGTYSGFMDCAGAKGVPITISLQ